MLKEKNIEDEIEEGEGKPEVEKVGTSRTLLKLSTRSQLINFLTRNYFKKLACICCNKCFL